MSKLVKLFVLLLLLAGLGTWGGNVNAATRTSTAAGGNWNATTTWVGSVVPVATDTAIIATTGAGAVNVNVQAAITNLTVNSGSILNVVGGGNYRIRPTGTTSISGALNFGTTSSSSSFTGLVTVTATGTWNNSGNQPVTFSGGLTNDGTFTGGTGTMTFNTTAAQTLSGGSAINFGGRVTLATGITVTNNNTSVVTITGNLNGGNTTTSIWVNGANATLNYAGANAPMATGRLTANASPNTVNYIGGAQTVELPAPTAAYHHLILSGTGAVAMPTTALAVNGNFTMKGNGANATLNQTLTVTGTTFIGWDGATSYPNNTLTGNGRIFNATGALTNYGTLNFATAASTLNLSNNLTNNGTLTFTNATSVIALAGASQWTGSPTSVWNIDGVNVGNYALSFNATDTFTINLVGPTTWTIGTGTVNSGGTNKTITFNYSYPGAQNIQTAGITYPNLTLSGGNTKTLLGGTLNVVGNLTIGAGVTYTGSTNPAVNLAGNFSYSGTAFNSGTGIYTFQGTSAQSITGAVTFQKLTANNTSGVSLNNDTTVSNTLTLQAGNVVTGANNLIFSGTCSNPANYTSTGGWVFGNLNLNFPINAAGTTTCIYHVGDASNYTPITVGMNGVTLAGTLIGSTTAGDHPDTTAEVSGIDPLRSVNRYWTLAAGTLSTTNLTDYSATFQFVAGDLDTPTPAIDTAAFQVGGLPTGGVNWISEPIGTRTSTTTQATGIAIFGSFVVGEASNRTCSGDDFNRATLNPSPIFGQDWDLHTTSGTFGLPAIVNTGYLRLTDNSGSVATAATVPSTYPAAGNLITVEFTHWAYCSNNGTNFPACNVAIGTGADGIGVTLSDASKAATPGAFGGSLGYAQKCEKNFVENNVKCVSDCTVAGGCPGFNTGWMGVGLDEYGNYSANSEGRKGGTAPGATPNAVAVRGSGSGTTGYPYLGGTGQLSPGVAAPVSSALALGHRYRITMDARGVNPATGLGTTSIKVERDTAGGSNYTSPLFTPVDAFVANASQSPVPLNWKISFTGSTGGQTNIHEISNLKICAANVQPSGATSFVISVPSIASTCGATNGVPMLPVVVTITAKDGPNGTGNVLTSYGGTVALTTSTGQGTWAAIPGVTQGTLVGSNYTFAAADRGVAKLYLVVTAPQTLTIRVSVGSVLSISPSIQFTNTTTFDIKPATTTQPEGNMTTVVAGRPHRMNVSAVQRTGGGGGTCGLNNGYGGASLRAWYDPEPSHPGAAAAPTLTLTYGVAACTGTSSGALPTSRPGSNNFTGLIFTSGMASFCLSTTDIGKYRLYLNDSAAGFTGSTTAGPVTVRPFAIRLSGFKQSAVPNTTNPGGGSVFIPAGENFDGTVTAVRWQSAADALNNGSPYTYVSQLITGLQGTPSTTPTTAAFNIGTTLTLPVPNSLLAATFTPATVPAAGGVILPASGGNGILTAPLMGAFSGGVAAATLMSIDNVGNFSLLASLATNFLDSPEVVVPSVSDKIGRFGADHFTLASGSVTAACNGFTYMGQPNLGIAYTLEARNKNNSVTNNYSAALSYSPLATVSLVAEDQATPLNQGNDLGSVSRLSGDGAGTWTAGRYTSTSSTAMFSRLLPPDTSFPTNHGGPFDLLNIGVKIANGDGADIANLDMNATTTGNCVTTPPCTAKQIGAATKVRFGRLALSNAYGSELLNIRVPITAQYISSFSGTLPVFMTNTLDNYTGIPANANCTSIPANSLVLGNWKGSLTSGNMDSSHLPGTATTLTGGVATLTVTSPTAVGSVDLAINLNATGSDSSCNAASHGGTAGIMPWLQGYWSAPASCGGVAAWAQDPNARIKFGSPKSPFIYLRERY